MRYALVDHSKVEAQPKMRGSCPGCAGETIAKCGAIKIWHWAHVGDDCDPWHEPESEWHITWKREAGQERCEVVMGPHRADIVGRSGVVIELQHSALAVDEIYAREDFYKNMIWLIDGAPFAKNVEFRVKDGHTTFRWRYPRAHHGAFTAPLFWDLEAYALEQLRRARRGLEDRESELEARIPDGIRGEARRNMLGRHLDDDWLTFEYQTSIDKFTAIAEHPIFDVRRIAVTPPSGGWGMWFTRQEFIDNYIAGAAGSVARLPQTQSPAPSAGEPRARRQLSLLGPTVLESRAAAGQRKGSDSE